MSRFALLFVTVFAGFAAPLAVAAGAQAAPDDPGTSCGTNMVMNTHRECVPVDSFCTLSDGMIIGTIGPDGRCVIPGTDI